MEPAVIRTFGTSNLDWEDWLERLRLSQKNHGVGMVVDVRSAEAVERFAEACFAEFAPIAVVFSNAGVLRRSSAAAFNLADWNYVLEVNLGGMAHCAAAFTQEKEFTASLRAAS